MRKVKQKEFKGTNWQDHVIAQGSDDPELRKAQLDINAREAEITRRLEQAHKDIQSKGGEYFDTVKELYEKTPGKVHHVPAGALSHIPADPWAHKSEGMRCSSCMWFVIKGESKRIGRCRRHAPTMGGFPVAYTIDWCGDHRLGSDKVD